MKSDFTWHTSAVLKYSIYGASFSVFLRIYGIVWFRLQILCTPMNIMSWFLMCIIWWYLINIFTIVEVTQAQHKQVLPWSKPCCARYCHTVFVIPKSETKICFTVMSFFFSVYDLHIKPSFLVTQYIKIRMVPMQCKWILPMLCIINCGGKPQMSEYSTRANEEEILPSISTNAVVALPLSTKFQLPNFLRTYSKEFIMMKILSPQASFCTSVLCQWKE